MRNQLSVCICVLLLGLTSCRTDTVNPNQASVGKSDKTSQAAPEFQFPIAKGDVKIFGQIQGYTAIYKTGKLTYREPGTLRLMESVFPINDAGSFHIDLKLLHPVRVTLDLEGKYHSIFLEPNNDYKVTTHENQHLVFLENGVVNNQLNTIRSAMAKQFKAEDARAQVIYKELLPVTEFKTFHDDLAQAKLQFLEELCVKNGIGDKARTVVENEIRIRASQCNGQ